ncbi:Rpn family recombination-promoting nuclease/putative transposase [Thiothrix subterranea]|uniref:Rpn family recombination-promoting nuclease/putative transposase n=1 Tax=Thiothrix subterranea TaxID=2735563 RepID=A0AA51MPX2_9GAMM|nr:Rpn family recombination-promoting nuclease/putative transposase [Thiothrix subterranea]MDQ5769710.1 Rpn family recombination-promoting nuclease/putative transposase [Thiothrix subterranea]QQZ29859.1 PD-(D/E)XK nuclease family transposase [Thiothrix subterranea]WML88504.1 Rpn family recombination-promoting nuclease/putative transposase [Thiothrix subterranea]
MQDKYVNPFTDFGFKKLFGEEPHKELLISFLNTLLPEKHQIQDLQYTRNEQQGASILDRKAIFDLSCVSLTGERFIVELQKAKQNYFKDRSLYYATFPIQEQAQRGDWDYKLAAVYTVGILDFTFEEDREAAEKPVMHFIQLKNQSGHVFYDKLTFIYLTLPYFQKTLTELQTDQDKWFYIFKHLHELQEIPPVLQGAVFLKLFEAAQIACFNPAERQAYEDSLKYYRDLKNVTDTAREEGWEEGREEGREEGISIGVERGKQEEQRKVILALSAKGLDAAFIADTLNLSVDFVQQVMAE